MTDPHTYFREATATLDPDVEALVSRGLERGRTRHRRRTTLAALAAGAAVAVVAVAAVSVPQLVGAGSTPIAPAGSGHAEQSAGAEKPARADDDNRGGGTDQPTRKHPRTLTVRPADVPAVFASIVGGSVVVVQAFPSDRGGAGAHFLWNGAYTTVIIDRAASGRAPITECRHLDPDNLAGCTERPDGSAESTWQQRQPLEDGGVTGRGYTLFTVDGWSFDVISYNAATPKAFEYVAPEPPLSLEQMERAASSDAWFE